MIRNLSLARCRAYGARTYLGLRSQPLQAGLVSGTPPAFVESESDRYPFESSDEPIEGAAQVRSRIRFLKRRRRDIG